MNGWLVEDDNDDELEEDKIGDDNDEEMEMDDEDDETEFSPLVVPIADADDEPIPLVIQFRGNYHVGENSSTGTLLAGNGWVNAPGPMGCNLESVYKGVTRLSRQMFDRYKTEKRMAKKFREDEFRMNGHEYDITALDTAAWVRRRIPRDLQFQEEPPIHPASVPCADDPYVMVRHVTMAAREDDNDDTW
nr:hypothetical protein [Tanacetum cinerariifolium]